MANFYGDLGADLSSDISDVSEVDPSEMAKIVGDIDTLNANLFGPAVKKSGPQEKQDETSIQNPHKNIEGAGSSKHRVSFDLPKTSSSGKSSYSTDFDEDDPLAGLLSDEDSNETKKVKEKDENKSKIVPDSLPRNEKPKNEDVDLKKKSKSEIVSKLFGLGSNITSPKKSSFSSVVTPEMSSPVKNINVDATKKNVDSLSSNITSILKNKTAVSPTKNTDTDSITQPVKEIQPNISNTKKIQSTGVNLSENQKPSLKMVTSSSKEMDVDDLLEDNSEAVTNKKLSIDFSSGGRTTNENRRVTGSYTPSASTSRESRRPGLRRDTSSTIDPLGIIPSLRPTLDTSVSNENIVENSTTSRKTESVQDATKSSHLVDVAIAAKEVEKSDTNDLVNDPVKNVSKSDWLGFSDNVFPGVLDESITLKPSPSHSRRRMSTATDNNPSKILTGSSIPSSHAIVAVNKQDTGKNKAPSDPSEHLPEWLGGKAESTVSARKKPSVDILQVPSALANTDVIQPSTSTKDHDKIDNYVEVLRAGEKFDQAAVSFLQHQDIQLLIALHLKQREKEMASVNSHQQEILRKQEQQLQELIDKQLQRQKHMEEKFQEQQERISQHLQALMNQPDEQILTRPPTLAAVENYQVENKQVQEVANAMREEEMDTMKSTYTHQISLLQEALEGQEKRLKHEISQLEKEHHSKIIRMQEEKKQLIEEHQRKVKALEEDKLVDMQNLKKFYHQELESLRSYYMKTVEDIHNSSQQNRYMGMLNEKLGESSQQLIHLQEKVDSSSKNYLGLREAVLKYKESELQDVSQKLDSQCKNYEQKHQYLVKLAAQLEERMAKLRNETEAKYFRLQQETLKFESRVREFELQKQKTQQHIQHEKEEIKHLRENINESQKNLRESVSGLQETSAKFHTHSKSQDDVDKVCKEAEAAIRIAQQTFHQAKIEREKLLKEKQLVGQERRRLQEIEKRLTIKAQELDVLTQVAVSTKKEGLRALEEAKQVEMKQNIRLTDVQRQYSELREREVRLGKEKADLIHEKAVLERTKSRLCDICKGLVKYEETQPLLPTAFTHSQSKSTKDFVDPDYIIMKYTAEQDVSKSLLQTVALLSG